MSILPPTTRTARAKKNKKFAGIREPEQKISRVRDPVDQRNGDPACGHDDGKVNEDGQRLFQYCGQIQISYAQHQKDVVDQEDAEGILSRLLDKRIVFSLRCLLQQIKEDHAHGRHGEEVTPQVEGVVADPHLRVDGKDQKRQEHRDLDAVGDLPAKTLVQIVSEDQIQTVVGPGEVHHQLVPDDLGIGIGSQQELIDAGNDAAHGIYEQHDPHHLPVGDFLNDHRHKGKEDVDPDDHGHVPGMRHGNMPQKEHLKDHIADAFYFGGIVEQEKEVVDHDPDLPAENDGEQVVLPEPDTKFP